MDESGAEVLRNRPTRRVGVGEEGKDRPKRIVDGDTLENEKMKMFIFFGMKINHYKVVKLHKCNFKTEVNYFDYSNLHKMGKTNQHDVLSVLQAS